MSENELSLKLLESYTRDAGRGVARIDYDTMDTLNASTGDVIEIRGMRRTVAKCLPLYPQDEGKGIIRIDGLARINTGTKLGDIIAVKKIKAVAAEKIIVAPLEAIPPIDERYLADALESIPLIKGDNVMVPYYGGRLTFQIIGVTPNADAVVVTQKTIFTIAERAEHLRHVPSKKNTECPNCKTEFQELDEHCRKCGHKLDKPNIAAQLLQDWVSAVESGDAKQVVSLYRDDGLLFGEGKKAVVGHDQILNLMNSFDEMTKLQVGEPVVTFFYPTTNIEILIQYPRVFGSVAVNSGRYVITFDFEGASGRLSELEAWFSFVYNKDDDGVWKIVSHHHSNHPQLGSERVHE